MTKTMVTIDILAAEITRLFSDSNILRIDSSKHTMWPTNAMAFEDEYAIVAVWFFDAVEDLITGWREAQDQVVELLGTNVTNTDPKSWDGYLVLVVADSVPERYAADLSSIRSDTRRVRKLLLTGDDVPASVSDLLEVTPYVRRALAPVLNIEIDPRSSHLDPLNSLSTRLPGTPATAAAVSQVVSAYEVGESLLEALHGELNRTRWQETDR